ncbi:ATP-binding protein [Streptomyces scabiei]|uniref:ATP-binding protein n=1 Tax=Streptomyces scabiei TaxID=1930 RepID=UPI0029BF0A90|nr:LuxR C-terminal-related transcriptional regulator [Streptomyces scabiei]MDX3524218.1 LuxR C-terminal-related transcriptional regulator [Streptomyces scabiei]
MNNAREAHLPSATTSFVGRRQALADVQRSMQDSRLVTLIGAGGVGKTRLALKAAADHTEHVPDGTWLVRLGAVRGPAGVAGAVAAALGLSDLGIRPVPDRLAEHLARRRALLVLDNCEHLVEACAELAVRLLRSCPDLRILATSRRMLDVTGERVFTVPSLSPAEGAELLRDRARGVGAEQRIREADDDLLTRLCISLDGLPLAIELAASSLRTLGVEQMTARLEDRFDLLCPDGRTTLSGQRTLRAAIGWSYELCAPDERLLWNRLSVFAGGFTLEAAESVCGEDGLSRYDVVDLLDRLVAQSVVLVEEQDGPPRYRQLDAIREYGRERLIECGEEDLLAGRHRDFFLTLARRGTTDWFGPGQHETLARLRTEHANVLAALDQGRRTDLARADVDRTSLELAAALGFHWCCNGFVGEGRRQLDRLLAEAPEPAPARARALWTAAWVAQMQGALDVAHQRLDEADALGERLADPLIRAYVRGQRGTLALYRGRPHEAVPLFEHAVAVQSELEGEPATLRWLFQLALAQLYLGDPRATDTARRALATAEAHGERLTRAYALWVLGYDAWLRGDAKQSTALMRASVEIHQDFHDPAGVAMTLEVLAWGTAALGEHRRAAVLLGALGALTVELGPTDAGPFAEPHARCEKAITEALGTDAHHHALAEGASYDTPGRAVAFALGTEVGRARVASDGSAALTGKEREVAACVARGMTRREISTALGRSPRTVEGHLRSILAKLGFSCPTQIAAWWTANEPAARVGK